MERPYAQITVEQHGPVCCVKLKQSLFDDDALEQLGAELSRLVDEENYTRVVVDFGQRELQCLYSLLLAKLIHLSRRLENIGGGLALTQVAPYIRELFKLTGIERMFRFYPDVPSAVGALQRS